MKGEWIRGIVEVESQMCHKGSEPLDVSGIGPKWTAFRTPHDAESLASSSQA